MSKANDPTKLQSYLTSANRTLFKPAKNFVKSDMVRDKIIEPAKALVDKEPLIQECIIDPIMTTAAGKHAANARWMASGVKEGIKTLSKPLLPSGLTEADLPDSHDDGYVCVHTAYENGAEIVETNGQRDVKEDWEEDTWEHDQNSVFIASSSQSSSKKSLTAYHDKDGKVIPLDDITDGLLTQEEKNEDVHFRSSEILEVTRKDKIASSVGELNRDVHVRISDLELNRGVEPVDIMNFAVERERRSFIFGGLDEPLYRCQIPEVPFELFVPNLKPRVRVREYDFDNAQGGDSEEEDLEYDSRSPTPKDAFFQPDIRKLRAVMAVPRDSVLPRQIIYNSENAQEEEDDDLECDRTPNSKSTFSGSKNEKHRAEMEAASDVILPKEEKDSGNDGKGGEHSEHHNTPTSRNACSESEAGQPEAEIVPSYDAILTRERKDSCEDGEEVEDSECHRTSTSQISSSPSDKSKLVEAMMASIDTLLPKNKKRGRKNRKEKRDIERLQTSQSTPAELENRRYVAEMMARSITEYTRGRSRTPVRLNPTSYEDYILKDS